MAHFFVSPPAAFSCRARSLHNLVASFAFLLSRSNLPLDRNIDGRRQRQERERERGGHTIYHSRDIAVYNIIHRVAAATTITRKKITTQDGVLLMLEGTDHEGCVPVVRRESHHHDGGRDRGLCPLFGTWACFVLPVRSFVRIISSSIR